MEVRRICQMAPGYVNLFHMCSVPLIITSLRPSRPVQVPSGLPPRRSPRGVRHANVDWYDGLVEGLHCVYRLGQAQGGFLSHAGEVFVRLQVALQRGAADIGHVRLGQDAL